MDISASSTGEDLEKGYHLIIVRRHLDGWVVDEDSTYILDTAAGGHDTLALCVDEAIAPLGLGS